jgi:excisionase family DNA binding protein
MMNSTAAMPEAPRTYQAIIDQTLQLVYSHHHRLAAQLAPDRAAGRVLTVGELRQGRLGDDLRRLSLLAAGQVQEPQARVLAAIESVVQVLFWPSATADYFVPRSFWDTELGRMLALAKYRAFAAEDLISIGEAAQRLGVTRPTIYRWLDDRSLDSVRDDLSGRTFVLRRGIDRRRQAAALPA